MIAILIVLGLLSDPSIYFVGNSYTMSSGGIFNHVKEIYDSVESDTLRVGYHAAGGATFQIHWNNPALREELESGDWDTVVFQEQSCMPVISPDLTYTYGDSLAWLTAAGGGQPVFFMTWARKKDPLMLEGLRLGYSRMGLVHTSPVAPCGVAFDLLRQNQPEIDPYSSDGAHPSVHGTYIAACVIALTVYEVDLSSGTVWQPTGVSFEEGEIIRSLAVEACSLYRQPGFTDIR